VPLEQTQGELSDLAAAILRAQLNATRKAHEARRGVPKTEDGGPIGFAVLAVGKFGGRELNYGSDVDVLFFYDEEGATPDGFPAGPYFMELAQDLSRALGTATALGALYEVDARLRPNGSKGPLASSLEAFTQYWKKGDLADWERLALTRARFVAGDARVGERAEHLVRSAVYSSLRSEDLAAQVRVMRGRLEDTADESNLKRGRGGIVDIEFMVQYLQLVFGPAYPPLRQANTRAALQALLRLKKVDADDGKELLEAYEFISRMAQRLRVLQGQSANDLPSKPEDLQKLALRAGYADEAGQLAGARLLADHKRHADEVRRLFDKYVQ
jgi:glutamate-ammonia-ligase adenylyltransferase